MTITIDETLSISALTRRQLDHLSLGMARNFGVAINKNSAGCFYLRDSFGRTHRLEGDETVTQVWKMGEEIDS